MRRWESEDTAEMRAGLEGQKDVLYVQFPTGSVLMEWFRVGDHWKVSVAIIDARCKPN